MKVYWTIRTISTIVRATFSVLKRSRRNIVAKRRREAILGNPRLLWIGQRFFSVQPGPFRSVQLFVVHSSRSSPFKVGSCAVQVRSYAVRVLFIVVRIKYEYRSHLAVQCSLTMDRIVWGVIQVETPCSSLCMAAVQWADKNWV
jgi:hypothetical protein